MAWVNFDDACPAELQLPCVVPERRLSTEWYESCCSSPPSPHTGYCRGENVGITEQHERNTFWDGGQVGPDLKQEVFRNVTDRSRVDEANVPTKEVEKATKRRHRIHIPHSKRPTEFVVKRNARERNRVGIINGYFRELQHLVPTMRSHQEDNVLRLPKASIIRGTIDYIQYIHKCIGIPNYFEEIGGQFVPCQQDPTQPFGEGLNSNQTFHQTDRQMRRMTFFSEENELPSLITGAASSGMDAYPPSVGVAKSMEEASDAP